MPEVEQRSRKGRFGGGQRCFGYQQRDTRTVLVHPRGREAHELVRPTGPLVLVPEEADAIAWAYRHLAEGGKLEQVVENWRGRRLTDPQGARFTATAVRDVLLRPMNAGLAFYKGNEIPVEDVGGSAADATPAIIDAGTWRAVRAILTEPARRPIASLLAPLLRCAVCLADPGTGGDARLSATYRTRGRRGTTERIYICRKAGHVSRNGPKLDAAVEELMVRYLVTNVALLRRLATKPSGTAANAVQEAGKLRDRLAGYHARAADMDPADYALATKAIRAKIAAVETRIVTDSRAPATALLARADDIPGAWTALSVDEKGAVIAENVEFIVIGHGISGGRDNTMHNVEVIPKEGRPTFM